MFKSKLVLRDISGGPFKQAAPERLVDYDGTVRPLTPQEHAYRTWTSKYAVVARAKLAGVPPK